eukprot:scaffold2277_cov256-Pinguiococcus_pyrenoidosus.AAC.5
MKSRRSEVVPVALADWRTDGQKESQQLVTEGKDLRCHHRLSILHNGGTNNDLVLLFPPKTAQLCCCALRINCA